MISPLTVYLKAMESKLNIIFSTFTGANHTSSSEFSIFNMYSNPFSSASIWKPSQILLRKFNKLPFFTRIFSCLVSTLLKSISSSNSIFILIALLITNFILGLISGLKTFFSRKDCRGMRIRLNGVLNSWEIFVKKLSFSVFTSSIFFFSMRSDSIRLFSYCLFLINR